MGSNGSFEMIVLGVVLVLVLKYAPKGLWPSLQKALSRWCRRGHASGTGRRAPRSNAREAGRPVRCCSTLRSCASSSAGWSR